MLRHIYSVALVFGKVLTQGTDCAFFLADRELEFPVNLPRADVVAFLEHTQMSLCQFGELRQDGFNDNGQTTMFWA